MKKQKEKHSILTWIYVILWITVCILFPIWLIKLLINAII